MANLDLIVRALRAQCPGLEILEHEPMRAHCSFRIGGPARALVRPASAEETAAVCRIVREGGAQPLIIGNGTNLLITDGALERIVVQMGDNMAAVTQPDATHLSAGAGIPLARLAQAALSCGLAGLEFAHGIPGSLGGAVSMNAGAYGGEMKQVVERVHFLEADGTPGVMSGEDLAFGYRKSAFMGTKRIITSAELRLESGAEAEITAKMEDFMRRRREKQPLELPSAGSVFKRPEGYFAGTLIEQCGLKGFAVGGACVSEKHAGFIVNKGGATCADVEALIRAIQDTVFQATGVELEPEIRRISLSE